ncbi:MAG TPA: sigma-70 family RNA polymerase sigma factor [Gemmatimonadaceae bacterium]|nr:sigma-70 family RNA polymerase sigma factor [Gemmatimonadaceae bacterium]
MSQVASLSLDDADDIVRRAQAGDVSAFESLYRAHAGHVLTLCRRMLRDDAEAGEATQDVFVRVWERLTTFRGQSAFGTWLHRLAVNVVLERLRKTRRDADRLIAGDEDMFGARSQTDDADTVMDVETALRSLPEGARSVFVLHDMEGYSHEEIAQMTGIAAGTARAQLCRARRALMKLLSA